MHLAGLCLRERYANAMCVSTNGPVELTHAFRSKGKSDPEINWGRKFSVFQQRSTVCFFPFSCLAQYAHASVLQTVCNADIRLHVTDFSNYSIWLCIRFFPVVLADNALVHTHRHLVDKIRLFPCINFHAIWILCSVDAWMLFTQHTSRFPRDTRVQ